MMPIYKLSPRIKDKFLLLREARKLYKQLQNMSRWLDIAKREEEKENPADIWTLDFPQLTLYRLLYIDQHTRHRDIFSTFGLKALQQGVNNIVMHLLKELQPIIDEILEPCSIVVNTSGPNLREYWVNTDYQPAAEAIAELLTGCQYTVTSHRDGFIISWSYDTTD